jgi:Kef-type K+ transport system membrane component KefB
MTAFPFLPELPLERDPILMFGLLLLAGYLAGEAAARLARVPRIVGYSCVGVALGPGGARLLDSATVAGLQPFVDVGLGLILFELGRRLDLGWFRRDRWLFVTALAESLFAFGAIFGMLRWLDVTPLPAALAAAIGIATSPAAVMMVAREERAEGQVTARTLSIVAVNSVAAFVTVTMLLAWAHREYGGSLLQAILHPVYLMTGSLLLGALGTAAVFAAARRLARRAEHHLVVLMAVVLIVVGAARMLEVSALLALLVLGLALRNLDRDHVLLPVDTAPVGELFFVVLFVVTGAMLDSRHLAAGGLVAAGFIAARFAGKSLAVMLFGYLSRIRAGHAGLICLALTPMSALAVIMVHGAAGVHPELGSRLASIVLAAVLVLEVLGPIAVKVAVRVAGEARTEAPR